MRIDAVEVKLNIAPGARVRDDSSGSASTARAARREIYFAEDPQSDGGTLPLLEGGVVLRVRRAPDGKSDSTVKLRPCRRSQLTDEWLENRRRRTVTPSSRPTGSASKGPRGVNDRQARSRRSSMTFARTSATVGALFSTEQQAFLDACADIRVNVNGLVLLGPIAASRWDHVDLDGIEIMAERWRIGAELDFLELSIRTSPPDARRDAAGDRCRGARLGIVLDDRQVTKTRLVLEHLAASASNALRLPTGSRGPDRAMSPRASGAPKRVPLPAADIDA